MIRTLISLYCYEQKTDLVQNDRSFQYKYVFAGIRALSPSTLLLTAHTKRNDSYHFVFKVLQIYNTPIIYMYICCAGEDIYFVRQSILSLINIPVH